MQDDGILLIDHDRCIGCGACILACPYDQRTRVEDEGIMFPDGQTAFANNSHAPLPKGIATKCDFCYHRADRAMRHLLSKPAPPGRVSSVNGTATRTAASVISVVPCEKFVAGKWHRAKGALYQLGVCSRPWIFMPGEKTV